MSTKLPSLRWWVKWVVLMVLALWVLRVAREMGMWSMQDGLRRAAMITDVEVR